MASPYRAVLLDLDGTLLDTIPDMAGAANAMRKELALTELPTSLITTFVGKGVDVLVKRTLAAKHDFSQADLSQFEQAREIFHRHYHRLNGQASAMYGDVLSGLDLMQRLGLKLAVVTNKPSEFTLPLLAKTGLTRYMQAVVCGDTLPVRKPDPAPMLHACELLGVTPSQAVAVGDSLNDALAARAAGCAVLAVPYGYNEGLDVQDLDVDGIVGSIMLAGEWIAAHS